MPLAKTLVTCFRTVGRCFSADSKLAPKNGLQALWHAFIASKNFAPSGKAHRGAEGGFSRK